MQNEYEQLLHMLADMKKQVLLFGASTRGIACAKALRALGIDNFCYIDNNATKQSAGYEGVRVLSPAAAYQEYPEAVVFICVINPKAISAIIDSLYATGFSDVRGMEMLLYHYHSCILQRPVSLESYVRNPQSLSIPQAILITTNRCTLRCKECGELITHFQHPADYPLEMLVKSVTNFAAAVDRIEFLTVMGGEALLHPDLPGLLDAIAQLPNVNVYNIGTNGTILPNQDILSAIKRNGVNISISNYGGASYRLTELKALLSLHGIAYDITPDGMTWFSMRVNTPHSDEEAQERYEKCTWGKGVPLIRNGYAHVCGYSGASWQLGYHQPDTEDYVDMLDDSVVIAQRRAQIIRMLGKQTLCAACRVCGWGFDDKLTPGEQIC